MKYSFKFLFTATLAFIVLNLDSILSQNLLIAPNGSITLGLGALEDMAFSPDGKYIATASSQGITLWDAQKFGLIKTLHSNLQFRKIYDSNSTSEENQLEQIRFSKVIPTPK